MSSWTSAKYGGLIQPSLAAGGWAEAVELSDGVPDIKVTSRSRRPLVNLAEIIASS